jgi:hypothetical protein
MSAAYLHLTRRVFGPRYPEQRGRDVIIFDFPDPVADAASFSLYDRECFEITLNRASRSSQFYLASRSGVPIA